MEEIHKELQIMMGSIASKMRKVEKNISIILEKLKLTLHKFSEQDFEDENKKPEQLRDFDGSDPEG